MKVDVSLFNKYQPIQESYDSSTSLLDFMQLYLNESNQRLSLQQNQKDLMTESFYEDYDSFNKGKELAEIQKATVLESCNNVRKQNKKSKKSVPVTEAEAAILISNRGLPMNTIRKLLEELDAEAIEAGEDKVPEQDENENRDAKEAELELKNKDVYSSDEHQQAEETEVDGEQEDDATRTLTGKEMAMSESVKTKAGAKYLKEHEITEDVLDDPLDVAATDNPDGMPEADDNAPEDVVDSVEVYPSDIEDSILADVNESFKDIFKFLREEGDFVNAASIDAGEDKVPELADNKDGVADEAELELDNKDVYPSDEHQQAEETEVDGEQEDDATRTLTADELAMSEGFNINDYMVETIDLLDEEFGSEGIDELIDTLDEASLSLLTECFKVASGLKYFVVPDSSVLTEAENKVYYSKISLLIEGCNYILNERKKPKPGAANFEMSDNTNSQPKDKINDNAITVGNKNSNASTMVSRNMTRSERKSLNTQQKYQTKNANAYANAARKAEAMHQKEDYYTNKSKDAESRGGIRSLLSRAPLVGSKAKAEKARIAKEKAVKSANNYKSSNTDRNPAGEQGKGNATQNPPAGEQGKVENQQNSYSFDFSLLPVSLSESSISMLFEDAGIIDDPSIDMGTDKVPELADNEERAAKEAELELKNADVYPSDEHQQAEEIEVEGEQEDDATRELPSKEYETDDAAEEVIGECAIDVMLAIDENDMAKFISTLKFEQKCFLTEAFKVYNNEFTSVSESDSHIGYAKMMRDSIRQSIAEHKNTSDVRSMGKAYSVLGESSIPASTSSVFKAFNKTGLTESQINYNIVSNLIKNLSEDDIVNVATIDAGEDKIPELDDNEERAAKEADLELNNKDLYPNDEHQQAEETDVEGKHEDTATRTLKAEEMAMNEDADFVGDASIDMGTDKVPEQDENENRDAKEAELELKNKDVYTPDEHSQAEETEVEGEQEDDATRELKANELSLDDNNDEANDLLGETAQKITEMFANERQFTAFAETLSLSEMYFLQECYDVYNGEKTILLPKEQNLSEQAQDLLNECMVYLIRQSNTLLQEADTKEWAHFRQEAKKYNKQLKRSKKNKVGGKYNESPVSADFLRFAKENGLLNGEKKVSISALRKAFKQAKKLAPMEESITPIAENFNSLMFGFNVIDKLHTVGLAENCENFNLMYNTLSTICEEESIDAGEDKVPEQAENENRDGKEAELELKNKDVYPADEHSQAEETEVDGEQEDDATRALKAADLHMEESFNAYGSLKEAFMLNNGYFQKPSYVKVTSDTKQKKLTEQMALLICKESNDSLFNELVKHASYVQNLTEACVKKYGKLATQKANQVLALKEEETKDPTDVDEDDDVDELVKTAVDVAENYVAIYNLENMNEAQLDAFMANAMNQIFVDSLNESKVGDKLKAAGSKIKKGLSSAAISFLPEGKLDSIISQVVSKVKGMKGDEKVKQAIIKDYTDAVTKAEKKAVIRKYLKKAPAEVIAAADAKIAAAMSKQKGAGKTATKETDVKDTKKAAAVVESASPLTEGLGSLTITPGMWGMGIAAAVISAVVTALIACTVRLVVKTVTE